MRSLQFLLASVLLGCGPSVAGDSVLDMGPAIPALTDTLLFGVRDVAIAADGDIWVLSRHEPFVRRFTGGKLIAAFGRAGEGPGEFRAPWSFVRGDRLIPPRIFDPGARLIVRLDSAGRELARSSYRTTWGFVRSDIEDVSYGQVFRAHALSESQLVSVVYLGDVGTTRDLRRSALVRFTALGVPIDTLVSFRDQFGPQSDRTAARWLVTVPLTAACPDQTTAVYDGITSEIRGYAGGPDPVWRFTIPPALTAKRDMPAADLERYLRHRVLGELLENQADTGTLERRVSEQLRSSSTWYAESIPAIVGLLCDDAGRLWQQHFDTRDDPLGKSRTWTVLGANGESATVRVPPGFYPLAFDRTAVLGVLRDSLGVETVARVTLPSLPAARLSRGRTE